MSAGLTKAAIVQAAFDLLDEIDTQIWRQVGDVMAGLPVGLSGAR